MHLSNRPTHCILYKLYLNFLILSKFSQLFNNSNQLKNAIMIISNQYNSLINSSSYIISTKLEELKLTESSLLLNTE